jgi:putative transposase
VLGLSRTSYTYEPDSERDVPVIEALTRLAEKYPAYGFQMMFDKLRQEGTTWNHKRVYRIYKLLKLHLRRKGKKRLPSRHPEPLKVPSFANQTWSADFMSDALFCGRRFRTFNVLDDFNREALEIEIDLNLPAQRVIRVLDRIALIRGYPNKLRLDNGPEFISVALADWAQTHHVELEFIQPGKPTQNSFIERFNRTYRNEVLDRYIFNSLSEVKEITALWIREYNEERPHQALNSLSPVQFLKSQKPVVSSFEWH